MTAIDWTEEAQRTAQILYLKHSHIRTLELEDVLQESYLALVKALKGFRADRGVEFETYLSTVIYNHLTDLTSGAGTIRVPRSARRRGVKVAMESIEDHEVESSAISDRDTNLLAAIETLPPFERAAIHAMLHTHHADRVEARRVAMAKFGTGKSMLSRVQRRALKLLKEKLS